MALTKIRKPGGEKLDKFEESVSQVRVVRRYLESIRFNVRLVGMIRVGHCRVGVEFRPPHNIAGN